MTGPSSSQTLRRWWWISIVFGIAIALPIVNYGRTTPHHVADARVAAYEPLQPTDGTRIGVSFLTLAESRRVNKAVGKKVGLSWRDVESRVRVRRSDKANPAVSFATYEIRVTDSDEKRALSIASGIFTEGKRFFEGLNVQRDETEVNRLETEVSKLQGELKEARGAVARFEQKNGLLAADRELAARVEMLSHLEEARTLSEVDNLLPRAARIKRAIASQEKAAKKLAGLEAQYEELLFDQRTAEGLLALARGRLLQARTKLESVSNNIVHIIDEPAVVPDLWRFTMYGLGGITGLAGALLVILILARISSPLPSQAPSVVGKRAPQEDLGLSAESPEPWRRDLDRDEPAAPILHPKNPGGTAGEPRAAPGKPSGAKRGS